MNLLAIAALLILIILAIKLFLDTRADKSYGDYKHAEFLTPAETAFLAALDEAVSTKYRVFAKVRLADILSPIAWNSSEWHTKFNRISAKHVDFLLCDKITLASVCAVELDDISHGRPDRSERDIFLQQSCQSAGIPLARFPVRRNYLPAAILQEVETTILQTHNDKPVKSGLPSPSQNSPAPKQACPKCGKPLVLRTAHSGPNAGSQFWGCSAYPACRFTKNISSHPPLTLPTTK